MHSHNPHKTGNSNVHNYYNHHSGG